MLIYVSRFEGDLLSIGRIPKDPPARPIPRILIHDPGGNRPFALDIHTFFVITKIVRFHLYPPANKGADRAGSA